MARTWNACGSLNKLTRACGGMYAEVSLDHALLNEALAKESGARTPLKGRGVGGARQVVWRPLRASSADGGPRGTQLRILPGGWGNGVLESRLDETTKVHGA